MPKISFSNNVIPIYQIDANQKKKIENLYNNAIKDVQKQIQDLKLLEKQNASTKLQIYRLNQLKDSLNENLKEVTKEVEKEIKANMKSISEMTIEKYAEYLGNQQISLKVSYAHISNDIINNITSGNLYKDQYGADWNFSKRIWGDYNSAKGELASIVTNGMLSGKGCYEIAKDLEKYVDPKVQKSWEWSKVYPGTRKKIDYNAQRLARTMISHAYQQSLVEMSKNNPFASGIEWRSALIEHRTCELCEQRHGQIFPVNELPLDHPNGLCTYLMVFNKSKKEIADDLANWVNGEENPELDKYATHLTGEDFSKLSKEQKISKVNISEKAKEEIEQKPEKQEQEKDWKQQIYEMQQMEIDDMYVVNIQEAGKIIKEQMKDIQRQLIEVDRRFKEIDNNLELITKEYMDNKNNNKLVKELANKRDMLINEYIAIRQERDKLIEEYKYKLKDKLSEIREMGITKEIDDNINRKNHLYGNNLQKEIVKKAYDFYPTSWVENSVNSGDNLMCFKSDRGFYNHIDSIIALSGNTEKEQMNCAIHELGHRFENTQSLWFNEIDFYNKRTKNEELIWLGPGYRSDEMTKKDDFVNTYMGKDYGGQAYELCSMGFEYIYTQPLEMAKDEDMETWILGLLAIR